MVGRGVSATQVHPESGSQPTACGDCGIYRLCVPAGLNQREMSLLDHIVKRKQTIRRGQIIFKAGQILDYIYVIRSGSAKTYLTSDDGHVQITGLHVPGQLLGLSGLGSKRYSCHAMALETTSVCKVSVERLEAVADRIPSVHYQMLRMMSDLICDNERLMMLLGKRSAEERLAAFLIGLSRRFAARNYSAQHFNLSMSRGDIGNYLGMAEETVCRVLSRLHKFGLICVQRRQVSLLDFEALQDLAKERVATGHTLVPTPACSRP